ncbi:hypothetical protein RB195_008453 [Necator americanus]|uniref:Peptide-N(4)-(N-acetyl-beta-glucosaminyl)asparagine amidase n=1 Tax=Necator americanus TaxID=51031 RepID=A0ABR1CPK7_NECAM
MASFFTGVRDGPTSIPIAVSTAPLRAQLLKQLYRSFFDRFSVDPPLSGTHDGIPHIVDKECAANLTPPLARIFNISISSGDVPEFWKSATDTSISKSDTNLLNNCCPISLLPTSVKMEKVRASMPVQLMRSLADLHAKINSADANRLFVVDFFADWCGPCRFIAPIFENFSARYTNATFVKVNVDNSPDISQYYGIRAMPTFVLIKEGQEMERIQGANPQALEAAINKYYSSTPANPNAANDDEKRSLQQFIPYTEKVKFYTDDVYKTLAISVIPAEELRRKATDENGVLSRLQLAKELLNWFKNDFFSWCDSPFCEFCGKQTPKNSGLNGTPTIEERESGADRVEVYTCECGKDVRFPRYNDPAKLLETRKGRCGEWANCFALMAAAMDFDVRYIYDVSDHVWVELWIAEYDNWVHCDPCENIIDRPLVYEKGWGKKLSYVIAFGTDHVYDVTWRYTLDHMKTVRLRNRVREGVLSNFLTKLNSRMAGNSTQERVKELRRRRVRELVEFLVVGERSTDGDNYGGRVSGDVAWRAARSELGCSVKKDTVITLNQEELSNKKFSLEYNCAQDTYTRGTETIKGWSAYANFSGQIQRKIETDWKMAYLCRQEGEGEAEISWSIDLSSVRAKIFRLQVFGTAVYENGSVTVTVCVGEVCYPMPKTSTELTLDDVPSGVLKISAHFSGGKGNNAFQQAQLFRTPLDSPEAQMKIDIEL